MKTAIVGLACVGASAVGVLLGWALDHELAYYRARRAVYGR